MVIQRMKTVKGFGVWVQTLYNINLIKVRQVYIGVWWVFTFDIGRFED
jgi:hypothetical protein